MIDSGLQIFGDQHRRLTEKIVGLLHEMPTADLTAEKLLVKVVTCDGLKGRGGCHPRDFVLDMRADRVEYIDDGAFALHVSCPAMGGGQDSQRRIIVRCEDIWVPPFIPSDSLRKIADAIDMK